MEQFLLEDTHDGTPASSFLTSYTPVTTTSHSIATTTHLHDGARCATDMAQAIADRRITTQELSNTAKGILIGMVSAFGTAALVAIVLAIIYFLRYTTRGRILLDRISRPGEFDDEQAFLREEEDALANMDDLQRAEYSRAKG